MDVSVREDLPVDLVLDPLQLLCRQRAAECEVEAQVRCMHERARLVHVLAEQAAQRRVQQVGRGVVAHRVATQLGVHRRLRPPAQAQHAVVDLRAHHDDTGRSGLRVRHERAPFVGRDRAAIADLTAAFRIERSAVEDELDIAALVCLIDALAVEDERDDGRVRLELLVAAELALDPFRLFEHRVELTELPRVLGELCRRAAAAALRLELIAEAVLVDGHARPRRDLLGHLDGEPVRVVEPERCVAVDERLTLRLRAIDRLVEHRESVRQCLLELRLLVHEDLGDAVARGGQLVVMLLHRLHDLGAEHRHEARLHPQLATVQRSTADEPAQHVTAPLVGWRDAVGDEERRRAAVLRDDADREVGVLRRAVRPARELLDLLHQGLEQVGAIGVAGDALEHLREALESHASVDVLLRQRDERPVGLALVLLEHVVPDLDVAPAVLARVALVRRHAGLRALIDEHLAVGSVEAGGSEGPGVELVAQLEDLLGWKELQLLDPDVVGLVIVLVHRRDERVRVETELRREELPAPLDRFLLPVIADREVAEHLEEGLVVAVPADLVDVGGAEHLLDRDHPFRRRLLAAEEVRHEGLHPRGGEEDARVILQHERRTGQPHVVLRLEELEKALPYL